jgi:solute carrier family 13 (sodium-dependent dicarboxylate transporter), member 2/3/5
LPKLSKLQLKTIFIFSGIAIALFFYYINPFHVDKNASIVLAIAALMISWWVTEALPMPVVALLPLILFPLLHIAEIKSVASNYADPIVFLFMGGFMIGLAIEKWNLHRRIALSIVRVTGTSGNRIILGFILATGFISMWISNTATTMMMFPIALSVIHVMKDNNDGKGNYRHFNLAMMLSIAYASNFGGIATIIGTPPNVAFVGYFEKTYHTNIDFFDWMLLCLPIALLLMFALYLLLTRILFPNKIKPNEAAKKFISEEFIRMGPLSVSEKRVLAIFSTTALLWILKDLLNKSQSLIKLDDTIIALIGAVALFLCPSGNAKHPDNLNETDEHDFHGSLLEWGDTKRMAWGILLLFGGGLALAGALEKAGLIQQLGGWLSHFAGGGFLLVLMVTVLSIFISEMMSNIAQVIVFAPVVCSLADAVGINPLLLGLPMTLAASCASMMPMGTPPNAIVFASGHIKIKEMMKAGLVINIVAIVLISLFCWFLLPFLMKV